MRSTLLLASLGVISLAGCKSDYNVVTRTPGELELEVTSPEYGEFMGEEQVVVTGWASPSWAAVMVEGEAVELDEDGNFEVALDVGGPYNVVEVEASFGGTDLRERIPVFSGHHPSETWPGAATGRILPAGFDRLGEALGTVIDDLGWEESIEAVLPAYESDYINLYPVGVSHDPTAVIMESTEDGLDTGLFMENVGLEYDAEITAFGYTDTIYVGFEEIYFGATMVPELTSDGLIVLNATDPVLDLGDADIQILFLDGWLVEWITDAVLDWIIEPITDLLLGVVLDQLGTIELGGPFAFEFDMMGTPLSAALSDLFTDEDGMGLGLGIGIGEDASMDPPDIPTPDTDTPGADEAHASFALHEGLFQLLIEDALIGMLAQEMQLGSPYGDIIGVGITGLPGGDEAPSGDGWCLAIDPGTAYVVRMQEGIEPIAVAYMPDFRLDVGVMDGSDCEDWLSTSLALEMGIVIENGAELGFDLQIGEGAVLDYGASEYDEDEVVEALSEWFGGLAPTLLSLLGGGLDLDLNSLLGDFGGDSELGGLLGDLYIDIVDSARLENEDGTWTEGLYAVSMKLWD